MNRNSNTYTIVYASVMVVIVAALLSVTAIGLKSRQDDNVRVEKMQDILRSVGKGADADKVSDKSAYIQEEYNKYIVNSFTIDSKGNTTEGDAFSTLINLKAEYDKPAEERNLPVFESKDDDGTVRYIIPTWGSGLWGPIWGYIALASDMDTIYGVVFAHKSETPGLGAEIATPVFQNQYEGKTIFNGDQLVAVTVLKGAGASQGNPHAVDAITGGTITSRAVESMMKNNFGNYEEYFKKMRSQGKVSMVNIPASDSVTVNTVSHE